MHLRLCLVLLLAGLGCSASPTSEIDPVTPIGVDASNPDGAEPDAAEPDAAQPDAAQLDAGSPRDTCAQFLACNHQASPATAPASELLYGPQGTCWLTSSERICQTACATGLATLRAVHPDVAACAE